jgi:hypothetical protein
MKRIVLSIAVLFLFATLGNAGEKKKHHKLFHKRDKAAPAKVEPAKPAAPAPAKPGTVKAISIGTCPNCRK